MQSLHSMKNGKEYSVLNFDRTQRTVLSIFMTIKPLKRLKLLLNSEDLADIPYFSDYTFSSDEIKDFANNDVDPNI